jgi:hypothetical protein
LNIGNFLAGIGYFDRNFDISEFLAGIGYYGRNLDDKDAPMVKMSSTRRSLIKEELLRRKKKIYKIDNWR